MDDYYRQQDRDREWRDTQARQQQDKTDNDYWWHPTQGFWAWMKQQDEYRHWRSTEDANRAMADWWQQREQLAADALRQEADARSRGEAWRGREAQAVEQAATAQRHEELIHTGNAFVSAFHNRFSETKALEALWREAADGEAYTREGFDRARGNFWELVNHGSSAEAEWVRAMLLEAGYVLQGDRRAPKLELEGFELLREQDRYRREQSLTLSIDHARPLSDGHDGKEHILAPENLRLMQVDDNSVRSDRWTEQDRPRPGYEPSESLTKAQESYRERIDLLRREQDLEQERRQAEQRMQDNRADYDYWWHPTQGFWAWMRNQERYRELRSWEDLRESLEAWQRVQDHLRAERHAVTDDAAMRHERLLALDDEG